MSDFISYNTYTRPEEDQQPVRPPQVREAGGTSSFSIRGGEVVTETLSNTSIKTNGLGDADGDWRATARDAAGLPVSRITPKDIVTIGEYGDTTVQSFVNMGVLREVSPGQYELTGAKEEAKEEQGVPQDDQAAMPQGLVQAVDNALAPFSQTNLEIGLSLGMSMAAGDMDQADLVQRIARESGVEPSEAHDRINFVINSYQGQTDHYLKKQGLSEGDLSDFYEFARTQKGAMMDALQSQFYGQDMRPWKSLVSKYMSNTAPSAEALQRAGLSVKGDLVWLDGSWMPIKAAAKAGLI